MQFIDLQAQYQALKSEIDSAIQEVLNSSTYILGPQVAELEQQISEFIGIKHTITCGNGTDALNILYMAYGIGAGDAVFCPDITFFASVEPACMLGATPVFCDVEKGTYNLCPKSLEMQIQAVLKEARLRPRVVLTVDFLGNPAEYNEIADIAAKYELLLIEDAAQSFGGSYQGRRCGTFGNAAITSFFPAKPLGCYGDGGAIFLNDDDIASLCRSLRIHGKGDGKYDNIRVGLNSRLDTIQAAVLQVKLKALKEYELDSRSLIATKYNEAFSDVFELLEVRNGNFSPYAQYAILAEDTLQREAILANLEAKGIPAIVYYPKPQHAQKAFENLSFYEETFSVSNDYCARTIALPMHPYLEAETQEKIILAVLDGVQ